MNDNSIDFLFSERGNFNPQIYAYEVSNPNYKGLLKIGYTTKDVEERVKAQFPVLQPDEKPYKIVFAMSSMREDGTSFTDKDIHKFLRDNNYKNPNGEWFECSVDVVKGAFLAVRDGYSSFTNRFNDFKLRPEQEQAIEKTINYFNSFKNEVNDKPRHFLWNAKMRFGKTFTAYELAKRMKWKRVLILTFKPAVENSWMEDLNTHVDFEGWQFVSRDALSYDDCDPNLPIVCFGSFQDYLGKNADGGIKVKNEWVHRTKWDCVILDEYHYGAWRDSAKELFESEDKRVAKAEEGGNIHNGIFAGVFGLLAGAQTVRTIYKFNDGHKEYSDDHSQHWIALAIGLVVLFVLAMMMAFWALLNYLRNYVLYF